MTAAPTAETVYSALQAVICAHAQAQDDGRIEDIVALYCADAELAVPGEGTYTGHEAIRTAWDRWKPREPQRHIISSVVVTEWSADRAKAQSDVVYVRQGDAGWAIQMVARYHDVFRRVGGSWRFSRRADEFIGVTSDA
jgi:3-phenylpropionate/cinnamic acid dioxygenase small subunit